MFSGGERSLRQRGHAWGRVSSFSVCVSLLAFVRLLSAAWLLKQEARDRSWFCLVVLGRIWQVEALKNGSYLVTMGSLGSLCRSGPHTFKSCFGQPKMPRKGESGPWRLFSQMATRWRVLAYKTTHSFHSAGWRNQTHAVWLIRLFQDFEVICMKCVWLYVD